jgi:alpha-tubulin suppressor-like RCC1 family protein
LLRGRLMGRRDRRARALTGAGAFAAAALAAIAGAIPAAAGVTRTGAAAPASLWIHIAAGRDFTCGIREGNTLWCWGAGASGALGTGHTTDENQPQQITRPTAGWVSVTAGDHYGCAVRKDGALWCWGYNRDGEAGIGTTVNVTRPHQVTTPASTGWTTVAAGDSHTCATRSDATLWCWGYNADGEAGIGTTANATRPHRVTTPARTGWTTVSAGALHTCATRSDATLWCWGYNADGELGLGSITDGQDEPQQVTTPASTGWTGIAAGAFHTCATRSDTTLWCWGTNGLGELGLGSIDDQDQPQQVTTPASTGWTGIAAGAFHTCATRIHALWCWGYNTDGELGIGGTTNQDRPQRVSLPTGTGWSRMAPGGYHTCATHTGHTLWCWGDNSNGQLGIDSNTSHDLPQQVTS